MDYQSDKKKNLLVGAIYTLHFISSKRGINLVVIKPTTSSSTTTGTQLHFGVQGQFGRRLGSHLAWIDLILHNLIWAT